MSFEAYRWALQQAPSVPAAKGKPAPASCRSVLLALAYHADKSGRHAFPSVATLTIYTDLSERTIRACLDRLVEVGLTRPCDPAVVAAAIPRADRRPDGFNLAVWLRRDNPADDTAPASAPAAAPNPGGEVQSPHPDPADGVQPPQPADPNGVQTSPNGVQSQQERGATDAPEWSLEGAMNGGTREPRETPTPEHSIQDTPSTEQAPIPGRCQRHAHQADDPGPCRGCRDARLAAEQVQAEAARQATQNRSRQVREATQARLAAVAACSMCDADGRVHGQLCDHDPDYDNRRLRGRAAVNAALAATSRKGHTDRDPYRAAMDSPLPRPRRLRTWIAGEVLPALAETGHYSMTDQPQTELDSGADVPHVVPAAA